MNIKRLVIENFKSIERIELIEPNPFTVFVGPNGSGKSNIFEALEFVNAASKNESAPSFFGGLTNIVRRNKLNSAPNFNAEVAFSSFIYRYSGFYGHPVFKKRIGEETSLLDSSELKSFLESLDYQQFKTLFRLFVGNKNLLKFALNDDQVLALDASNLEKVLKRLLTNDLLRREIFEWIELFVPSFQAVEVDDRDELHWFETAHRKYFTKDLISDGTYNILALLTAVYQSDDKPQFLCIEEPENGLHPQVARELVDFFRLMCEERGHYIWLNTHSPYMVSRVKPEELVVVDKVNGATQIKQFNSGDFDGIRMDDAWLTNVLNGGKAW